MLAMKIMKDENMVVRVKTFVRARRGLVAESLFFHCEAHVTYKTSHGRI